MDDRTREAISSGADAIRSGLSTPEQVLYKLIGYSNPNRDEAMALIEGLVAARGPNIVLFKPVLEAERALVIDMGAGLIAHGLSSPEAIKTNLVDPDTPERDELLHAIYALGKVRKASFHRH